MKRLLTTLRNPSGVTLVELIVAIVVVFIALGGVLTVLNLTTRKSADPMVQRQAVAIAEAYLEEILSKAYDDPNGNEVGENRATFDDVDDYHGLNDNGARDQFGNPIAGLGGYSVQVTVATAANLGAPAVTSHRVNVQVSHAAIDDVLLFGYRADY